MSDKKLERLWYVLHTKSRFESVVNDGLQRKQIEVFLPKITVKSKRRDRKAMIRIPLFPVKTAGAVRLIGSKKGPVPVPDETIDSLRIMVSTDLPVSTGNRLQKGDRVMVVSGPFVGVTGTFVRYRGQGRVIVNIEALGQYAGVEVSEDDLEILPKILS
jgi:transcription antitermination factor NusG